MRNTKKFKKNNKRFSNKRFRKNNKTLKKKGGATDYDCSLIHEIKIGHSDELEKFSKLNRHKYCVKKIIIGGTGIYNIHKSINLFTNVECIIIEKNSILNNISEIDLSKLPKLKYIDIYQNKNLDLNEDNNNKVLQYIINNVYSYWIEGNKDNITNKKNTDNQNAACSKHSTISSTDDTFKENISDGNTIANSSYTTATTDDKTATTDDKTAATDDKTATTDDNTTATTDDNTTATTDDNTTAATDDNKIATIGSADNNSKISSTTVKPNPKNKDKKKVNIGYHGFQYMNGPKKSTKKPTKKLNNFI